MSEGSILAADYVESRYLAKDVHQVGIDEEVPAIYGRVVDSKFGSPIEGATITVGVGPDIFQAVSGVDGFFSFVDLPARPETVSVYHRLYFSIHRRQIEQGIRDLGVLSLKPREYVMKNVSDEEIELLAKLIQVEAGGEPYQGKVAVGAVVVNRVKNKWFPNTIEGVIRQPRQFAVAQADRIAKPNNECVNAAYDALRGIDPTGGAIFFYNPYLVRPDNWVVKETAIVASIGDHVFSVLRGDA